jgi:hypothetical protein
MKIPLIAPIAIVLLLLAACEQKSAQITSSSPPPAPAPSEAVETPDFSGVASSSVAEASPTAEAATSPSTNGTSNARPVFRNEDATQAANQYLDSYNTVLNDVTAVPGTRSSIPTDDPKAAIEAAMVQARKVGQDTRALANQQKQVNRLLAPDEKKRLREYQKSLEQGGQDTEAGP